MSYTRLKCSDKLTLSQQQITKVEYAMDKIPEVGFGFWKVDKAICADTAYEAIKAGYRHLDCASDYGNEKGTVASGHRGIEGKEKA